VRGGAPQALHAQRDQGGACLEQRHTQSGSALTQCYQALTKVCSVQVLLDVVGLNTEEKGSSMEFLRRGFKRATWWEDADGESKEESSAWRY
jgi:hypothetical protein